MLATPSRHRRCNTERGAAMRELSQFLYKLEPVRADMLVTGPTRAEAGAVKAHYSYLQGLTERGTVLLAGRTSNLDVTAFGIVLFLADSEPSARAIMEEDPAVLCGVMRAELFPFRVALVTEEVRNLRGGE